MEAANRGPFLTINWIGRHDSSFGEPHYSNNPPHFDMPSECTVMQWTLSRRMTILCQNRQQGVISTMALRIWCFWNKGNKIFRNLFFVAFCVAFIIMTVVFDGVISDSVAAAATLPPVWLFPINSGSKSVNGYSGIVTRPAPPPSGDTPCWDVKKEPSQRSPSTTNELLSSGPEMNWSKWHYEWLSGIRDSGEQSNKSDRWPNWVANSP